MGFGRPGRQAAGRLRKDLTDDLIPFVQANYRVSTDRKQRALAGLSRGGGQTLSIGLRNLALFSRLGVFSAGGANPQETFKDVAANAAKVNEQLDLLWIGCGTEDGAMAGAQRFADFLTAARIKHTFRKTPGSTPGSSGGNISRVAPLLMEYEAPFLVARGTPVGRRLSSHRHDRLRRIVSSPLENRLDHEQRPRIVMPHWPVDPSVGTTGRMNGPFRELAEPV